MCFLPVLKEHVAESYPVPGIALFIVVTYRQLFLVEWDALLVMAEVEVTLGIGVIVKAAFVWGIGTK